MKGKVRYAECSGALLWNAAARRCLLKNYLECA